MYPLNFKISPPPPTAATAATPARAHFITFISDWWHFIHSSSLAILHWAARCCENVNSTLKKIQTEKKYLSIWQVLSSQSSHYLAQTKPGPRFWSPLSISKPLLNNSMCVWRMENASVLHLLGGMYESRAQLQQHNILFAKFLKLLWKSSHREKLAAAAAPVVLFKFEHFLGTSLPLHIAGYFNPRKMAAKFHNHALEKAATPV